MKFHFCTSYARWLVVAANLTIAGCGGGAKGPATVPASGTVTYKGEPVKMGSLTFAPTDANVRAAQAQIVDGRYKTEPGQGLMVGNYKIVIQSMKQSLAEFEANKSSSKKNPDDNLAVPKKYTNLKTTDLMVTVNEIDRSIKEDFDLKD